MGSALRRYTRGKLGKQKWDEGKTGPKCGCKRDLSPQERQIGAEKEVSLALGVKSRTINPCSAIQSGAGKRYLVMMR